MIDHWRKKKKKGSQFHTCPAFVRILNMIILFGKEEQSKSLSEGNMYIINVFVINMFITLLEV